MMYQHGQISSSGRGHHQTSHSESSITPGTTADPVLINRPLQPPYGQFAGETVRYELKEIQKACLGRKYARVDRRPLDPPPVVLVHIWRYSPETGKEEEVNYEEVQTHGLLCTVDLFPVPAKSSKDSPPSSTTSGTRPPRSVQTGDGFVHFNLSGPSPTPSLSPSPSYRPQSYGPSDIVYYYEGNHPLLESSKTTQALVGATFVQPVLVELFGKKCIVFVFSDLAVKSEGTFTLRYRIFDLFSPNVAPSRSSQSSPGPYPSTPSTLSVSPTPSPTSQSGFAPSSPSYGHPSSLARSGQSQYHQTSVQSQFQSHSTQATSLNPYPDPSQNYTAPPPIPQQPRSRRPQPEPEIENPDYQAVFAPHDAQTRVEPSERDTSLSILAECWAKGSFRIYSTKEFPGLPASTDLTKQLARWGVRLNIRETERRRRRRSTIDQPEEVSRSDGETDDVVETMGSTREQQPPIARRPTNIQPRPQPAAQTSPRQPDFQRFSPHSPSQPPPNRRISPSSPSSGLGYDRSRLRQDSGGDEDYEDREHGQRRSDQAYSAESNDYDESPSNYSHSSDRLRNPSRPTNDSGMPAFQPMYSSASASFDPALNPSLAHPPPQLSASPTNQMPHYEYGVPAQTQGNNAPFAHSGLRSSINGAGHYQSDSHHVPTGAAAAFPRYASSARRRDSVGGSSTTSRRSGGSVGSAGEFQGIGHSFHVYGVAPGMDGGSQA